MSFFKNIYICLWPGLGSFLPRRRLGTGNGLIAQGPGRFRSHIPKTEKSSRVIKGCTTTLLEVEKLKRDEEKSNSRGVTKILILASSPATTQPESCGYSLQSASSPLELLSQERRSSC